MTGHRYGQPLAWVALLTLTLLVTSCRAAFAGAGEGGDSGNKFNVCNMSEWTVYAAIAWWGNSASDSGWNSVGWFTIKSGECHRLFPQNSYDHHRYLYAEAKDNSGTLKGTWQGGGILFCVHPTLKFVFRAEEQRGCPAQKEFAPFPDKDTML